MEAATASAGAAPPRHVAAASQSPLGGPAAYAAELIGTLTLVFFISMIVSVHSAGGLGVTDFAVIGLVHCFVLMMLIHSLGGASGAHFNPAVTIGLWVARKIKANDAIVYIVMQLIGGILGALLCKLLLSNEGAGVHYGALGIADAKAVAVSATGATPPAGPDWLGGSGIGGFGAEAIGTFFLMWAIMATAVNPRAAQGWAGFVIGATLALAVLIFAPLTGAGFNPARWLGPGLAGSSLKAPIAFIFGPIVGSIAAVLLYTGIVLKPEHRQGQRPIDTFD